MAIRNIVKIGDEVLTKKAKEVMIDARLFELLDDLVETMRSVQGLGLAAPQVGVLKRVAVIEVDNRVIELINPKIISKRGRDVDAEGCLSIPGRYAEVARPKSVVVGAYDRDGEYHKLRLDGLAARAACHEIDHLDGELFINKAIRYLDSE